LCDIGADDVPGTDVAVGVLPADHATAAPNVTAAPGTRSIADCHRAARPRGSAIAGFRRLVLASIVTS
jgi:hypothetical protein